MTIAVCAAAVIYVSARRDQQPVRRTSPFRLLGTAPGSYLGLYTLGVPKSYAGLTSFTEATGVRPNVASYYSGWYEPFQAGFARTAAGHGAVPLVQIDPTNVSLAAIAVGRYDAYLKSFAHAVRAYGRPVVLGFGHEMNGTWYSWGHGHTAPEVFVAAWRHIVTVFRDTGAQNVTWLWTVNAIERKHNLIPDPTAWWPGSSYVTWVGIDGYFHRRSSQFATVFGPTIAAVRQFTKDPVLISETGAGPDTGQPAKIATLFAGIRAYGLLGFVWFDTVGNADYRIDSPAALAAFRQGGKDFQA